MKIALLLFLNILLLFTLLIGGIAYAYSNIEAQFFDNALSTRAKVINAQINEFEPDDLLIEINFRTQNNQTITTRLSGSADRPIRSGDHTIIYYDPDNPEKAELERQKENYDLVKAIANIFICAFVLILGLMIMILKADKNEKQHRHAN